LESNLFLAQAHQAAWSVAEHLTWAGLSGWFS
jgi:hypothetical protein